MIKHPIETFMLGAVGVGKDCNYDPPDAVGYSGTGGVTVYYFYSQLWRWDAGSNGWYKLRDKGPYQDVMHLQGGGWPEAPDVVDKNPPWRYELLWYWSTSGWKRYAEAYSYNVGNLISGDYSRLYC
jgi:hypothetical protein